MTWYEPADTTWTYASRRLIPARLAALWITFGVILAVLIGLGAALTTALWIAAAGVGVLGLWCSWVVVWQVRNHAWAERDDDLLVKRGKFYRRVTVVPYGRMQYVEVHQGPIARMLGIAKVQLHTASPGTDAHLSGVVTDEAARLRDRLTERGEAQLAGL